MLIFFVWVFGVSISNSVVQAVGCVMIVCYFIAKLGLGRDATKAIRGALKSSSVELSGSKYSFSDPLTIKVPKNS
jgi:hypothetical protein